MPDRTVIFDILAKVRGEDKITGLAARVELLQQKLKKLDDKAADLPGTMAALGPAILPVLAGATVAAVGFGTAIAAGGAALGVFGAVTASAFTEVKEAADKTQQLSDKMALLRKEKAIATLAGDTKNATTYQKALTKATYEYQARLALLPPQTRKAVEGYNDMKTAWSAFVDKNKPAVYKVLAGGFEAAGKAVGKLQPLFDVGATAAGKLVGVFERFVSGGGLDKVVTFLSTRAGPALTGFGHIAMNLGIVFGNLLAPFASTSGGIVTALDKGTGALARWSGSTDGVSRFFTFATSNGPAVVTALGTIATTFGHILTAVTPLAPVTLAVATAFAMLVNHLPGPVLTTLIGLFLSASTAIKIVTAATKIWTVAQIAFDVAMTANPLGILIVTLAAVGVALTVAWKKSETFRNVVTGAFKVLATLVIGYVRVFADSVLGGIGNIIHAAATLATKLHLPMASGLRSLDADFQGFKTKTDAVFTAAQNKVNGLGNAVKALPPAKFIQINAVDKSSATIGRIQTKMQNLKDKSVSVSIYYYQKTIGQAPSAGRNSFSAAFAGGVRNLGKRTLALVGEEGPELLTLPRGSDVYDADTTGKMMSTPRSLPGGGEPAPQTIVVKLQLDGRTIQQALLRVKRGNGGAELGLV